MKDNKKNDFTRFHALAMIALIAICLWFKTPPEGVQPQGWQSFVIFLVTLSLIISKAFEMGAVAFIGLSLLLITKTLPLEVCLFKFSYPISWLVLMAFFIAKGFMVSGLGPRIALFMAAKLGSTPLRLSYALVFAETLMAPFILSNTARGAGLIYPIAHSLGDSVFGKPVGIHKNSQHLTAFLLYTCFQANLITSSMFLTAMAGNPMIVDIAGHYGVECTWMLWFKAAAVPGIICLLITPLILQVLMKPHPQTTVLVEKIHQAYQELGLFTFKEGVMGATFILLLLAWVFEKSLHIHPTSAAIIAVTTLLVADVLSWHDITSDSHAWTTFIWLTVLFTLTAAMKEFGLISWLAHCIGSYLPMMHPVLLIILLTLVNFYAHYFFASLTSHISTFLQPLMMVGLHVGLPLKPLLLSLAFSTCLSAGLTHYGTGTGIVIYGTGYWTLEEWWRLGFFHSTLMLIIFLIFGLPFWF